MNTPYYQPLFDYMSNQHGLHLLESDLCEIINIVSKMKNKERIGILESEISRLNERLTLVEGKLGIADKPDASNPDFIPDWKDAPEWATCKAMDKSGIWNWYSGKPYIEDGVNEWCLENENNKYKLIPNHPPSDKYWTETLEMRPTKPCIEGTDIRIHTGNLDTPNYTAEPSGIISVPFGLTDSEEKSFVEMKMKVMQDEFEIKRNGIVEKFKKAASDRLQKPDYTHLLPEGYEFCQEADAEKWVKVKKMLSTTTLSQTEIGHIATSPAKVFKPYYRPIRPIQLNEEPAPSDPYQPDWAQAPEGTVAHAWDEGGKGYWYLIGHGAGKFGHQYKSSNLAFPPDLDWKQSLRIKPSK